MVSALASGRRGRRTGQGRSTAGDRKMLDAGESLSLFRTTSTPSPSSKTPSSPPLMRLTWFTEGGVLPRLECLS